MKVENMEGRSGKVANQFIVRESNGDVYFQSYNSVIVKKTVEEDANGERRSRIYLDEKYWNYSVTTGKYRNKFLRETKKETEKKIANGEYKLVTLN